MSEIKLCKDCKYFCRRPAPLHGGCSYEKDPVYGGPGQAAFLFRRGGDCGMDAKYFEPKPVPVAPLVNYFAGLDPCVPPAKPWWRLWR